MVMYYYLVVVQGLDMNVEYGQLGRLIEVFMLLIFGYN